MIAVPFAADLQFDFSRPAMPEVMIGFITLPVITGSSGKDRIYDGCPDGALDMVSSRVFDGRLQLLEYVPTVLVGPPVPAHALGNQSEN